MSFGPIFSSEKEYGHETKTVPSRTDCLDSHAGRARHGSERHCAPVGISEQTFYQWKKQYAGMQVEGVRELKILQEENARLKKLVAELSLDKAILQDVVSKSGTARAATGSGEVHRELRRPKVGAGLQTDEAGTQHSACTAERTQSCRCSSVCGNWRRCVYGGAIAACISRCQCSARALRPERLGLSS